MKTIYFLSSTSFTESTKQEVELVLPGQLFFTWTLFSIVLETLCQLLKIDGTVILVHCCPLWSRTKSDTVIKTSKAFTWLLIISGSHHTTVTQKVVYQWRVICFCCVGSFIVWQCAEVQNVFFYPFIRMKSHPMLQCCIGQCEVPPVHRFRWGSNPINTRIFHHTGLSSVTA